MALVVKNLPANAGDISDAGSITGFGNISSSRKWQPILVFLPAEFPWTEEPGGLQSIGSQRVRHDWSDLVHTQQCQSWVATEDSTKSFTKQRYLFCQNDEQKWDWVFSREDPHGMTSWRQRSFSKFLRLKSKIQEMIF